MSAVGRVVIVVVASIAHLIRIDVTVLPSAIAHLDGVFRSFLSVILLQEQLNNPCCRTTVLLWLKRLKKISSEQTGRGIFDEEETSGHGSDVPADNRATITEMICQLGPPLDSGNSVEKWLDCRDEAWRRLILLFVRVENPTLQPYALEMQAKHPLSRLSRKAIAKDRGLTVVPERESVTEEVAPEHDAGAGGGTLEDRLEPFQMGNLRFAFRLIDSDADGLIDIDDIQFFFQQHSVTLTAADAHQLLRFYSVLPKAYHKEEKKWVAPNAVQSEDVDVPICLSPRQKISNVLTAAGRTGKLILLNAYDKVLEILELERSVGERDVSTAQDASGPKKARAGGDEFVLQTTVTEVDHVGIDLAEFIAASSWEAGSEWRELLQTHFSQSDGALANGLNEHPELKFQLKDAFLRFKKMDGYVDEDDDDAEAPFDFKEFKDLVNNLFGYGQLKEHEIKDMFSCLLQGASIEEQAVANPKVHLETFEKFYTKALFGALHTPPATQPLSTGSVLSSEPSMV